MTIQFIFRNFDPDYEAGMRLVTPKQIQKRADYYGCKRKINVNFLYQDETAKRALLINPPSAKALDLALFPLAMECAAWFNANLEFICKDNSRIIVPSGMIQTVMHLPKPETAEQASKADHLAAMWGLIKPQFKAHSSIRSKHKNTQLELFSVPATDQAIAYQLGHFPSRLAA
jgi:hypothetical protein